MLGIIDYGSGNIAALTNIFKQRKVPHFVSGVPRELAAATCYLLPGVGAFPQAIAHLRREGMAEALDDHVRAGKPLL